MNKLEMIQNKNIEDMIYEINGKQVMLDSDLAYLYECKNGTKEINQAVRNNIDKFPERFSWKLTDWECQNFLVKNFDQKIETRGGRFKNPRVFTEQGVAMLATILKSKVATDVSIRIMDAFVLMRHFIMDNKDIYVSLNNINNKLIEHDEKINYLFYRFDKKEQLFLPGETYDAYYEIVDILNTAKEEIIIIDNYADKTILDFIRNIDAKITIITSNKSKISSLEIDKFNSQYNNKLKLIYNNTFHDRYFILDGKEFFYCGTSLNHAGEKMFSIHKIEDKIIRDTLINYINKIKGVKEKSK